MKKLRYGNPNTYFIDGLLFDTDMPETLSRFFKATKQNGIPFSGIRYVIASHYHLDHVGLIRELTDRGVILVVVEQQTESIHFADEILNRQYGSPYRPIDETRAIVISSEKSRSFLKSIGISGEIIPTSGHSKDGIALILDNGTCFVGDSESPDDIGAYGSNTALERDWKSVLAHKPKVVYFGHAPEQFF